MDSRMGRVCLAGVVVLSYSVSAEEGSSPVAEKESPPPIIGEETAVKRHISQADIDAGKFTL